MAGRLRAPEGRDTVAIILAIGLSVALSMLMFGVMYDALRSDTPGLSENATQVIIAAFGGIVGVLGSFIGGRAVERAHQRRSDHSDEHDAEGSSDAPGSPLSDDPPPS